MPLGRLIGTGDLRDVADHGLAGERVYLKGQFVVNFSDANKAVLRPRTKLNRQSAALRRRVHPRVSLSNFQPATLHRRKGQ